MPYGRLEVDVPLQTLNNIIIIVIIIIVIININLHGAEP